MKIKNLFNTPKKASLAIIGFVATLVILSTGTAFAARAIAQSSSIGADNAKNYAFADAGIDPTTVKAVDAKFGYEQGQFVYEVEFTTDNADYEYLINASDGTVVKKNMELVTLDNVREVASAQITLEKAKEIALSDAKLDSNHVTYTAGKLEIEDGLSVYEIDFYSENVEYEYEINANTGAIYSKSKEINNIQKSADQSTAQGTSEQSTTTRQPSATSNKDNTASSKESKSITTDNNTKPVTGKEPEATNQISLNAAKEKALADADLTASSVTFTKTKLDKDDGIAVYEIEFYTTTHEYEYEIDATSGIIHDKSVEVHKKTSQSKQSEADTKDSSGNYIGLEKAKSIAAKHAGFSISEVTFSKAKLDTDKGKTIYDIEFYKDGMEYDYEIDASTGKILEYDSERDD